MDITCPKCRYVNAGDAAFCSRCGTALAASGGEAPAPPSGWDLATAGMAQAAPTDGRTGALRKEEYAGWWARLGASILDGLILGLLFLVVFGAIAGIVYATDPGFVRDFIDDLDQPSSSDPFAPYESPSTYEDEDLGTGGIMLVLGLVIGAGILTVAWETLWLRSRFMAMPGQSIAGFRVVSASGTRQLSTGRSFGRACAKLIYNIPNLGTLCVLASAFTIGLTEKRQALHDMIAGTVCVRTSALERRGIRDANGPAKVTTPAPFAPATTPTPPAPPSPPSPPSSGPFV